LQPAYWSQAVSQRKVVRRGRRGRNPRRVSVFMGMVALTGGKGGGGRSEGSGVMSEQEVDRNIGDRVRRSPFLRKQKGGDFLGREGRTRGPLLGEGGPEQGPGKEKRTKRHVRETVRQRLGHGSGGRIRVGEHQRTYERGPGRGLAQWWRDVIDAVGVGSEKKRVPTLRSLGGGESKKENPPSIWRQEGQERTVQTLLWKYRNREAGRTRHAIPTNLPT